MITFLTFLRSIYLLIVTPLVTCFYSFVTLFVIAPTGSRKASDDVIHRWARSLCTLANIDIEVQGLENLKGLNSGIIVSNHLSHFDIPVLYVALPLSFRMVAKAELFRIPLFGRALSALHFVPVERETSEGAKSALKTLEDRFSNGEYIWIAAEGTRFAGEGVGAFKSGAFHTSVKTKQPIVPVCLYGTQKVLPKGSMLVSLRDKRPKVIVSVGQPLWPKDEDRGARHELRDRVRDQIVKEFANLRTSSASQNPG